MEKINYDKFSGCTFLITGATGMIGKSVINRLVEINKYLEKPVHIIAHIRNVDKFKKIWGGKGIDNLEYIVSDITKPIILDKQVDYIVHGASITSSKSFIECPVDTIHTALKGTENILNFAKNINVKKVIYLSSMEVYGTPQNNELISEKDGVVLDTSVPRNSYPESKRMCESMCSAYHSQYDVPVVVLRLTQTFGPGFDYNDGRIFAEFTRCVIEDRDIILHTKGETRRSYLYTEDAVNAIFVSLLNGKKGENYNVANKTTYCSIYEMAKLVSSLSNTNNVSVKVECQDSSKFGYAPTLTMNLDTTKLENIGWSASVGLKEMFQIVIDDFKKKGFGMKG